MPIDMNISKFNPVLLLFILVDPTALFLISKKFHFPFFDYLIGTLSPQKRMMV